MDWNKEEIKKSHTVRNIPQNAPAGEDLDIKKIHSSKDLTMDLGKNLESEKKKDLKESGQKKAQKTVNTAELKEKAGKVPVLMPKKKTKKEKAADAKKELNDAKAVIKDMHTSLKAEELKHFSKSQYQNINRNYYENLSESDIKKRAEKALERKKNAQGIMEYEAAHVETERKYAHLSREAFIGKIAKFKELRDKPFDMGSDEEFVKNLAANYSLCEAADYMKHWIDEAVELGYMPEDEDMAALQTRIATFAEVKEYLDAQKELMKNPYYQYMARDDISYTDEELKNLLDKTDNAVLKDYLTGVSIIRSLHFVRHKGMDSARKHAEQQGKRMAEILATKEEKRGIIDRLSDKALQIAGNKRFLDKDYDARFTPQLLEEALGRFRDLKIENLHFGSLMDIAEHYDENEYAFEQVHDVEHLLFVAVQRGLAPADDALIELRAKIEAFTMVERMVADVQKKVLDNPDDLLNGRTYKEFENEVFSGIKSETDLTERHEPPRIGGDLKKYLKSMTRRYKQEHKDREKTIRLMYGLTHPVKGEEGLIPGDIPDEELEKRKVNYQKNAYFNEYLRNTETYMQSIYGTKLTAIACAHARQTGRAKFGSFGRTLTPYLTGRSADEVIKVIDVMQTGTDKEKEELYKSVAEEVMGYDFSRLDARDPVESFRNAAYRQRIEKIGANLGGSTTEFPNYVKDKTLLAKYEAYYGANCSGAFASAVAQAAKDVRMAAIDYEEWHTIDGDSVDMLMNSLDADGSIDINAGGMVHTLSEASLGLLDKCLGRISFMHQSGMSKVASHADRAAKGIREEVAVTLYDELKNNGVVKAVTPEEAKEISDFCSRFAKDFSASTSSLYDDVLKELKKNDPAFKPKGQVRPGFLSYMSVLNRYDEKEELSKSTSMYKSIVVDGEKTDAVSKQNKARAIEEIFRTIMAFDLRRFDFKSYKDIITNPADDPTRYEDCFAVSHLAMDAVNYIEAYKKLRMDEEVSCRLNGVHVDEIKARCELLMSAESFYDEKFGQVFGSEEPARMKVSVDDVMHMTQAEIGENLTQAIDSRNEDRINFWANVKSLTDTLSGFDIQVPLSVIEDKIRFRQGLHGQSKALEAYNLLNGTERVLDGAEFGDLKVSYAEGESFKNQFAGDITYVKYTVSERESKLYNSKSRIYKKRLASERLKKQSDFFKGEAAAARRSISLKNRIAAGEKNIEYLSAFMEGDAEVNNSMAERYADEKTRDEILDIMTMDIMEINLDIKAVTDEDFAKNAYELERISSKALAYDKLIKANPGYKERLMNRRPGARLSDLEMVEKRLNQMLAVSDYYRARKALITDPYYVLHYNEELSADADKVRGDEDRLRIAELINLVSQCARRMQGSEYRTREDSGIESVLERAESIGRQNAHLIGRPDLTRAEPSAVRDANKQIGRFAEAAGLGMRTPKEKIAATDDAVPFPQAQKYYKGSAKNLFDAVRTYSRFYSRDINQVRKVIPNERLDLYDKLCELFKDKDGNDVTTPTFNDPKTGEVFSLTTDIQRLSGMICCQYAGDLSDDEVLEIFEGLLITYRTDVDLQDEKQRLYARERFLNSLAAVFRMEYENMKRYQNTYGTLGDDLPFGVFMEALGDGQKDFFTRNLFGQDMANLVDTEAERESSSDGKPMTTAEILVKYGKITAEEMNDAMNLGTGYYQIMNAAQNPRFFSFQSYDPDREEKNVDVFLTENLIIQEYTKDNHKMKGPKVSTAEARNIWKKALKYDSDDNLTGGKSLVDFKKASLNLYTPAEKKAIGERRRQDANLLSYYNFYLDEREEVLLKKTRNALGGEISDDLLKKLIVFHPGMLSSGKIGKNGGEADVKGTTEFIENVRKYAGIGMADDQKAEARKQASEAFFKAWNEQFLRDVIARDVDSLMGGDGGNEAGEARFNASKIMEGSRLLTGEVRHRCFESIKFLAGTPGLGFDVSDKTRASIKGRVKDQISQEIVRRMATDRFYLELKDIGSRRRSYPERMHVELVRLMRTMRNSHMTMDDMISDQDLRTKLGYFGIGLDDLRVFSVQPVQEARKEENKAGDQPLPGEEAGQGELVFDEKLFEEELDESGIIFEEEAANKQEEKQEEKKDQKAEEKKEQKKEQKINVDEEIAAQQQQNLHYEIPPVYREFDIKAPEKGTHVKYESQGAGTSYCWACTMSGLMNAYAGKKVSDLNMIKNKPLSIPKFEESGVKDRATYDAGVNLVNSMYAGTEYGNPAIFGDYIQDKLPTAAVRTAIISREDGRLDYCKRRFRETLGASLQKGPVGMLVDGHFMLIREIKHDDVLMVNDSLESNPDAVLPYVDSVDDIFAEAGQQVELVWLEDMTNHEAEIANQFDLNYDAQNGTFSFKNEAGREANAPGQATYKQVKNEQTILHKNGIEAMTQLYDDVVFNSVYLPRQLRRQAGAQGAGQGGAQAEGPQAPAEEEVLVTNKQRLDSAYREEKKEPDEEVLVTNKQRLDSAYREPNAAEGELKPEDKQVEKKEEQKEEKKEEQKAGGQNAGAAPDDWGPGIDDEFAELDDVHVMDLKSDVEGLEELNDVMEPGRLVADMDKLDFEELVEDNTIEVHSPGEWEAKLNEARDKRWAKETGERIKNPGMAFPDGFSALALKEKGKKGSFSKKFKESAEPVIKSIEKIGNGTADDEALYRSMGIESPIEMIYVGGEPLSIYVRENYNYSGNDLNVLKNYAAFIAGRMEVPIAFFAPRIVDGRLTYEPRNLDLSIGSATKADDEAFRKRGIRNEQLLRENVPLFVSEKAGRAYREQYFVPINGFREMEDIADRIKTADRGSDPQYAKFLQLFDAYYQAIERWTYYKLERKNFARLHSYASQAGNLALNYMRGKKVTKERHRIAIDASRMLDKHVKTLGYALDKGILKDEQSGATFVEIFGINEKAAKEAKQQAGKEP